VVYCFPKTFVIGVKVKVEKQSRVEASLLIREEELIADFTINSVIRAMQSVIPVYVKDKKTKRILALLEISSENLPDVFKESDGFTVLGETAVSCETKGSMRAVYGAEQIIRVQTLPLDETRKEDRDNSIAAILAC